MLIGNLHPVKFIEMKKKYKDFITDNISVLRSIKILSPKNIRFEEINFNKGIMEDAETFSLIDPVLKDELKKASKSYPLFKKLISIIPFRASGK
jgi:hypothetical protein